MAGNWMEINMIIFKMENILYLKMAKMEKKEVKHHIHTFFTIISFRKLLWGELP